MAQSTGRTAITESVARDEGRSASALRARAQQGDAQAEQALTAERSVCSALKRAEGQTARAGPADQPVDVMPAPPAPGPSASTPPPARPAVAPPARP